MILNGFLQFKNDAKGTSFYLMELVFDGDVFAGTVVSMGVRPGTMRALVASPGSTTLCIHKIKLEESLKRFGIRYQVSGIRSLFAYF